MGKRWTKEEIKTLEVDYPSNGGDYCSKKLNRSIGSIFNKVNKLGLRLNEKRNNNKQKLNAIKNDVISFDFNKKEDVYVLGLLWADGYLSETKNRLELEIVSEDFNNIEMLFKNNKWSKYKTLRDGRKEMTRIGNYIFESCEPLRELGFSNKSEVNVDFMGKIPIDLQHYFVRGFFDGDGCFYYHQKRNLKQCTLAGNYGQNWSWIEELFLRVGIDYSIKLKTQNGGKDKYSVVQLRTKDIKKFGEFIYKGYEEDKIGFKRKWEKYSKIINSFPPKKL